MYLLSGCEGLFDDWKWRENSVCCLLENIPSLCGNYQHRSLHDSSSESNKTEAHVSPYSHSHQHFWLIQTVPAACYSVPELQADFSRTASWSVPFSWPCSGSAGQKTSRFAPPWLIMKHSAVFCASKTSQRELERCCTFWWSKSDVWGSRVGFSCLIQSSQKVEHVENTQSKNSSFCRSSRRNKLLCWADA